MPQLPACDVQEALIERELLSCCYSFIGAWEGRLTQKCRNSSAWIADPSVGTGLRVHSVTGNFQARSRQKKWGFGDR